MRRNLLLAAALVGAVVGLAQLGSTGPTPVPFSGAMGHGSTIVLVHGLGSGPDHWLPVARRLAQNHRVVLVELPGHGVGAMPEPFSLETATEALDATLRLQSREPVVLVGHSVGGLVAVSEALAHPERVSRLVLVETALRPQIAGHERAQMLQALATDYHGVLHSAYSSFGRDSAQGEMLYAHVAGLDSTSIARWIRLAVTADLSNRAAALRTPVLAVLAERSWPRNEPWPVTGEALGLMSIPHLEPMRISGCGHFIMLDRPEALAAAIDRFAGPLSPDLLAVR